MNEITAQDWELYGLFEQEPIRQELDENWLFDDSVYTAIQDSVKFTCAIHPYHKDVRLMLWYGESIIYEYSAIGVQDIQVHGDALKIQINQDEVILVTVRPALNIKHETPTKT